MRLTARVESQTINATIRAKPSPARRGETLSDISEKVWCRIDPLAEI